MTEMRPRSFAMFRLPSTVRVLEWGCLLVIGFVVLYPLFWLVLGSSLAALFGVEELTGRAINVSTANLRSIETFAVVAVIYVVITVFASASLALAGRWMFRVKAKVF